MILIRVVKNFLSLYPNAARNIIWEWECGVVFKLSKVGGNKWKIACHMLRASSGFEGFKLVASLLWMD